MGTIADQLNTAMRDFVRFTGDGLPGEPVGRPLPQGDPASGQFNPPKKQVREAFLAIAETADNLNETAEAVTADRVQTGADRAAVSAYTAASLTYRDQAQNAALAVGAPIVTALTSPVPADGTIEVLQTGAGGQVWQVADGAWGGADGKPVGWLTKPEFPDIATMAASSGFVNGQEITANGEPFEYKSEGERDADGDPVTADGALVVDAVGMETGQFVSKRAEYADYDEVKADPRSFTAGKVLKLRGIEGTLTATDGSGNWNGKTAGGQAFDTSSVTGDVRLWGAAGASDDTAALQAAIAASDKITLGASHVLTGRMNLKDWQLIEGYNQSKIQMQAGMSIAE